MIRLIDIRKENIWCRIRTVVMSKGPGSITKFVYFETKINKSGYWSKIPNFGVNEPGPLDITTVLIRHQMFSFLISHKRIIKWILMRAHLMSMWCLSDQLFDVQRTRLIITGGQLSKNRSPNWKLNNFFQQIISPKWAWSFRHRKVDQIDIT